MPDYFKTKNFASFVRQLNMYSFYKVKSMRNRQEFRHPFFRRDQPNDLKYVKRKNVNKNQRNNCESRIKSERIIQTKTNTKDQIDKLKAALDFIAEQNKTLRQTNLDIVTQLYSAKDLCQSQLRDFISMMFVMMNVPNAKLVNEIKDRLDKLKIDLASVPIYALIDRNVANINCFLQNYSEKGLNIQVTMENVLRIYKSYLVKENIIRDPLFSSDNDISEDKGQILAAVGNPNNKTTFINDHEDLNTSTEVNNTALTLISISVNVKPQTCNNHVSPLPSIKNEDIIEELNDVDFILTNHYNERDYDSISLSEFVFTPATPLFQEDI